MGYYQLGVDDIAYSLTVCIAHTHVPLDNAGRLHGVMSVGWQMDQGPSLEFVHHFS